MLFGTIVVAIRTLDAVHVGVDSKVISIRCAIANAPIEQKLHQVSDVVFAHAGLFRDVQGKLDVVATATASIAAGGELEQVADHFVATIESQLSASLHDVREQNPPYFRAKLQRPLEVLFVSARDGVPKIVVVFFEVADPTSGRLGFRVTRLRCPGDCSNTGSTTIALGEHDAADHFLDTHPELLRMGGPFAAIKEAISNQASVTPDFVSLPTVVVSIDRRGTHFLN